MVLPTLWGPQAVKPWIGAIKEPSDWSPPDDLGRMPDKKLQLSRVYGYRCRSVYSNVHVAASGVLCAMVTCAHCAVCLTCRELIPFRRRGRVPGGRHCRHA